MREIKYESLSELAQAVRQFLQSDNVSMKRVRSDVVDPLRKLGSVYVIGGLVRDIALYGPDERPVSDLDLVVKVQPYLLDRFAEAHGAVKNRFGGYAIKSDAYRVDVWALSNTWARKAGHANVATWKDLRETTFFDWDAVVYGINENRISAIDNYLSILRSGVIGINLLDNPSELGSLVRALRRLVLWRAIPSHALMEFIESKRAKFPWSEVQVTEQTAFSYPVLVERQTYDEVLALLADGPLDDGVGRMRIQKDIPDLVLPRLEPPVPKLATASKISKVPVKVTRPKRTVSKDLFGKMR